MAGATCGVIFQSPTFGVNILKNVIFCMKIFFFLSDIKVQYLFISSVSAVYVFRRTYVWPVRFVPGARGIGAARMANRMRNI